MSLSEDDIAAMSEFAVKTKIRDMPEEVVSFGRLLFLDTLGVMVGGLRYPQVQALGQQFGGAQGSAGTTIPWGRLVTLGAAATWLDSDSGGSYNPWAQRIPPDSAAHPTPHSAPMLLHEAASGRVTDVELLEVFILANELAMRSSVASHLRPGVHPHGIHGPIASALVTALLGGMSSKEITQAILLSSSVPMSSTMATPMHGGTVRNIWTGLGAYYGAWATNLVTSGFQGSVDTYVGLFDRAVSTDLAVAGMTDDLGSQWQILLSYLKRYACARWIHSSLDAVGGILRQEQLGPEDIETVTIETFEFATMLNATDIRSDLHARFSLPYCVATLIYDGEIHAGAFLPGSLDRPEVAALAKRIVLREEPRFTAALPAERPACATIVTTRGTTHTLEVRLPRGNPETALTRGDIEKKFRSNVGNSVPQRVVDEVVDSLLNGESGNDHSLTDFAQAVFEMAGC